MNIGMNLLLWTSQVTEEHFPVIAAIRATGFDGVELPIFDGTLAQYQNIGRELKNQGLRSTAVTVVGPETNPSSSDAAIRQAAVDRLKWVIDMIHAFGGETLCGPYHSPLGVFSGTGATKDEKKFAAETLRTVAEYAAQAKVRLAIEYLNRFECYFINTAVDTAAFVKQVNHPNFGCMYDTFHAHIEEKDPVSAIATVAPHLFHVHISENDRGTPGTGQVRWADSFKAIKKTGYDGWMVIEAFGRALPELAAATRVWRDFFTSREEVYQEGYDFIRKHWKA
ncbi:MAG: sugar phosphate isomerase/epimerase [Planctomycetia bacterium]|nr:sugar phosphate isomerase/epimerase [Planctomycetia bacterium]